MAEENTNKIDDIKLVAFKVGTQEYCVNIMSVREIRGWTMETKLPMVPDYVRGVINLRGSVVPIVDMASRIGVESNEPSSRNVIIIFELSERILGFVVNDVTEIFTTSTSNIQPTPDVVSDAAVEFVQGVIAMEGRMLNLLGLENVLPRLNIEQAAA